jgi:hypothetical protein
MPQRRKIKYNLLTNNLKLTVWLFVKKKNFINDYLLEKLLETFAKR